MKFHFRVWFTLKFIQWRVIAKLMGEFLMRKYMLPSILMLVDILILCFSVWLAIIMRFSVLDLEYQAYMGRMAVNMPIFVMCHLIFFYIWRLYSRVWKYAGIKELLCILLSNACGMAVFIAFLKFTGHGFHGSVLLLSFFFDVSFISATRFLVRYLSIVLEREDVANAKEIKVLVVGAGDAGNIIVRDIKQRDYRKVVGFIDDDADKWGQYMNGIRIMGGREQIEEITRKYNVKEIVIAIPSLSREELACLGDICSVTGAEVKILPEFFTSMDSPEIRFQDLRPLAIEDLLNRAPIKMDPSTFGNYLENKTILVTGAGGSIGSEICRQIMRKNPKKLILLGRGENSIYEINRELSAIAPKGVLVPYIMNITNKEGMEKVFRTYRPEVVFHAAAHKHVPLMECEPDEAVYNNIYGFENTAEPAGRYGVERFVLISTDKAVSPTSVMGATKRVTEMVGQALNNKYPNTKFMGVRFGNVLGSRGSVVPLFKKQIAAGGPVTVTHKDMRRYFMTIPEASQLVIEAGALGKGGEVFVLNMGEPVKIVDLATNMIKLSGLKPNKDIEIVFTGLRPGEKMYEELLTAEEGTVATKNSKIMKAVLHDEDPKILRKHLDELYKLRDEDEIIAKMQEMIPMYTPNHFHA